MQEILRPHFKFWKLAITSTYSFAILDGQLFKRSLARVSQNRVLSHFHFSQRFYLNTIYREQFQ